MLAVQEDKKFRPSRTVLVLGCSYGGHRASQVLATLLPQNWRVVVIERNTHYNHLYAFPRVSVVPGHEEKVFIPYTKLLQPPAPLGPVRSSNNELIHGVLKSLSHRDSEQSEGRGIASYIPIDETFNPNTSHQSQTRTIAFDYMIFALGSILPAPINTWSIPSGKLDAEASQILPTGKADFWGGKQRGVKWLRETQDRIAAADSILIIGGGALGVQYASDIAWMYGTATSPPKKITEDIESSPVVKQVEEVAEKTHLGLWSPERWVPGIPGRYGKFWSPPTPEAPNIPNHIGLLTSRRSSTGPCQTDSFSLPLETTVRRRSQLQPQRQMLKQK